MSFKENVSTRSELEDKIGGYFKKNCSPCGRTSEFHVNDTIAFQNSLIQYAGTLIGIFVIAMVSLLFWNMGYITNIGLILGVLIIGASNATALTSNVNVYNKYKITRNPKD